MDKHEEYWKFAESERHFNTTQAGIRGRASTWILAAFAAIALLIKTGDNTAWLVPNAILIGLVGMMATVGLVLLWINDQMVYQQLLNSVFLLGIKREFDDRQIPPIKSLMMYSAEGKGMSRWMTFYYTIPMAFFLMISVAATILREVFVDPSRKSVLSDAATLWILVVMCATQLAVLIWVHSKQDTVTTRQKAKLFELKEFTDMFDGSEEGMRKFGEVVKRYEPDGS